MHSRIWPVIRKEFIHILRDPRTLAVMFIAPLMQLILFGYAATSDVRNVPMAVLDQDRTPQSRHLVTAFPDLLEASAEEMRQRIITAVESRDDPETRAVVRPGVDYPLEW